MRVVKDCLMPHLFITVSLLAIYCLLPAQVVAQTAPPTINSVSPVGAQRGKTVMLTIEGINLKGADQLFFSDPGLEGKIVTVTELGPEVREQPKGSTAAPITDIAIKYRLTIELKIAPQTPTGRQTLRVKTSLGTTNSGVIAIKPLPEVVEVEPNNSTASAQKVSLPATVSGTMDSTGDQDLYEFEARSGQELVFEVVASAIQSTLDSSLTLLDTSGKVIASNEDFNGRPDSLLAYKFTQAGKYLIRISDTFNGSGKRKFYLLNIGELPYVTNLFPLGLPKGKTAELHVKGYNLDGAQKVRVKAPDTAFWGDRVWVPINLAKGEPLNKVRVAVGPYPEIEESESNDEVKTAQPVTLPVTVNGYISATKTDGRPDQDIFKFSAKKGQRLVFSVAAQRLGSMLDPVIEVLDAKGHPIPRAVVRPLVETYMTLRDHGSTDIGIRVGSVKGINVGDYVLIGGELIRVERLPENPDTDVTFMGWRGQRLGFEGTTPEAHAIDSPIYKVAVYQPGTELPPGGMAPITLTYRNDDGGSMYGKDSYLNFVAPADGDYYLKLKDVREIGGDNFAYRLTVGQPSPDYTLMASPPNPNVPLGGSIPLTVTANRINGFDGKISVKLEGLPKGLAATSGVILPGHYSTTLTISNPANSHAAQIPSVPLRVVGTAEVNGQELLRVADPEDPISIVSVASPPDLTISLEPAELTLEPGGEVEVRVKINRANGFAGRVPVSIRNLPFGISIPDVGLNGVLVTENETSRTFKLVAEPTVGPLEQQIYAIGRVETNSPVPSEHAAAPIKLTVVPKRPMKERTAANGNQ